MSRPAGALLVNWFDLDEGVEPEFERWHNGEHAAERVGLPGFLSCRRYVSAEASPPPGFGRLIVYEAASVDAFASAAYRERLDRPTTMTMEIVPRLRRLSRAILSVETGRRNVLGTWLACTAFEDRPDDDLLRACLDAILAQPAITG